MNLTTKQIEKLLIEMGPNYADNVVGITNIEIKIEEDNIKVLVEGYDFMKWLDTHAEEKWAHEYIFTPDGNMEDKKIEPKCE